jgi:polar amino acid transport system substrate-binding protein
MRRLSRAAFAAVSSAVLLAAVAACAPSNSSNPSASSTSANACDNITTVTDGTLTVGTSNPAYPPYVIDNKPSNGKGFESALAYAVAEQMGFSADQVTWTYAPFTKLFAPGSKDYDFALNQISITPNRERAVTFSDPYYTAPNAVLVLKDSQYADATSVSDFKDAKIGVQSGTTGQTQVEAVIQPSQQVAVYPDTNTLSKALENGQIDALVTDLPTTLYLRDAVVSGSTVVGTLPATDGGDQWGMVLQKDNPLVACVNQALGELQSNGTLDQITQQWMADYAKAPELQG